MLTFSTFVNTSILNLTCVPTVLFRAGDVRGTITLFLSPDTVKANNLIGKQNNFCDFANFDPACELKLKELHILYVIFTCVNATSCIMPKIIVFVSILCSYVHVKTTVHKHENIGHLQNIF